MQRPWHEAKVLRLRRAEDHMADHSEPVGAEAAESRLLTSTLAQPSVPQPRALQTPPPSLLSVGPRQQVPEVPSASSGEGAGVSHQLKRHSPAIHGLVMFFASQTEPPRGMGVSNGAVSPNSSPALAPATWLCHAGKISGIPVSTEALVAIPETNVITATNATTTMTRGHLEIQYTKAINFVECPSLLDIIPITEELQEGLIVEDDGRCFRTSKVPISPCEMSTTQRRTFSFRISRAASKGGKKSITRTSALMTQSPMKRPNSRRGLRTLAKFVKKLAEVVNDVARQAFPACRMV
mmetsp:Transcript_130870/g.326535  ORF Transcript_130870/g.326535 Transcript_130870/m.326535 type:complete len:295 (-) Transcript_130870:477-1361(-)